MIISTKKLWAMGVGALFVASIVFAGYKLVNSHLSKYDQAISRVGVLETQATVAGDVNMHLNQTIAEQQRNIQLFQQSLTAIASEYQKVRVQLEERQQLVQQMNANRALFLTSPEIMENKINVEVDRFILDLHSLTNTKSGAE